MLNLYSVFHLNLAFSSIEDEQHQTVIQNCYWPLLKLVKKYNFNPGIELTGYTLERILKIDPDWILEFKSLLSEKRCELIGSGYCQVIGPLVPSVVNQWNQDLGKEIYQNILEIEPKVALINEMSYSRGILEHYIDSGYSAVIMEWNNPYLFHHNWSKAIKYFPQILIDSMDRSIELIWAESIAFQKFQRYAHNEIELEEIMKFLTKQSIVNNGFFPIYSNDVEIFDFRPGRFETEAELSNKSSEWNRIEKLLIKITEVKKFKWVLPSSLLNNHLNIDNRKPISLETAEQPIPVKKQEKYNINRWALTGRDDFGINTLCQAFRKIIEQSKDRNKWKELCFLWASDYRTHITEKRWKKYIERLESFKIELGYSPKKNSFANTEKIESLPFVGKFGSISQEGRFITIKNDDLKVILNDKKGLVFDKVLWKHWTSPLIGTLEHGYFDDISLGADFYSNHTTIERPGKKKITDLNYSNSKCYSTKEGIELKNHQTNSDCFFLKRVFITNKTIQLDKTLILPSRFQGSIYPFHITFFSEAWDHETLFYATNNGGSKMEYFDLFSSQDFEHSTMVSSLVSSKHALGATEGIVLIGDKDKYIEFKHDVETAAMIPCIIYKKSRNKIFLRLQYSIQELDETFREQEGKQTYHLILNITAFKRNEKIIDYDK